MKISNNSILNLRNITLAVSFVFLGLNSAQAQNLDSDKLWTTVGSDGTVDEADASKVRFDHSIVQLGSLAIVQAKRRVSILPRTQSAVIRYNVTPVDGLFVTPTTSPGLKLTLRYLDTDSRAQVVAKLIEVDLATGLETQRLFFDSNAFAAADTYQVKTGGCDPLLRIDFRTKGYYVEATLKSGIFGDSAAGIQMIKIENSTCVILGK